MIIIKQAANLISEYNGLIVMIYIFNFLTVLTKFCDYDHPEAFEVWGRSLICEKEYPTAKKKIELALKYTKVTHLNISPKII